ncbi:transporter [Parapedobacter lycopersici]|uniref:transporter n=1 Tax=Parapedobacter lycopersici TaxID=1864939 RepID=UPI003340291E
MKHIIITFLLCLAALRPALACDICGCGVGTYYLGILPDFNKRFVGLRYQHRPLTTHLGPSGNRTPLTADESYQSYELWGAWNFGTRWRAMAIIPYNFNRREIPGGGEAGEKSGLGDVALMGYYKVFEQLTGTSDNKILIHSLWAGIGIKTPTGRYDNSERTNTSQDSPNNFQLGTASTDFMANLAYDIRLMDLGLNVNASYKINTENNYAYRYGNKLTANALFYYKFNIQNRLRIAPNAGIMYETQEKDETQKRYPVAQSGGYATTGIIGLELNAGRLSLGANHQLLLDQHLADGRAIAGNRWMAHASFAF